MTMTQVTFGGCGGMYSYFAGVASVLQPLLQPDTVFYGVSAGSIPALFLAIDYNMKDLFEDLNVPLLKEVQSYWLGSLFVWNKLVRKHLLRVLPEDAYKRASHRLAISLTRIPDFSNQIVTSWTSNEDLVDCVLASSFVPVFDTKLFYVFRNNWYIDGSLTDCRPKAGQRPVGSLQAGVGNRVAGQTLQSKVGGFPASRGKNLVLEIDKWRPVCRHWYFCWTNIDWSRKLFDDGVADATCLRTSYF